MSYGPQVVYQATIASGATLSTYVDIARSYKTLYLEIPTLSTASNIFIQGAATADGTYRRIFNPSINSSTVGINVFQVLTAASNGYVPIPNGIRFLKVETSTSVGNGATFNIICSD